MGTWGTGLYQGDYAADLKVEVVELLSLPLEVERLLGFLCDDHPEAAELGHERYPEFWLVVRDQFHAFGIECEAVSDHAAAVIRDGTDLDVWLELGGSESDMRRRAKQLDKLSEKWSTPRNRPQKRKLRDGDQPFLLNIGDVVAVNYGQQLHERYLQGRPPPDLWGAFVVLNCIKLYGILPRYAVAQLTADSGFSPPTLEACLASDIDNSLSAPFLAEHDPAETFVGEPMILPAFVARLAERGLPATPENVEEHLRKTIGMALGEDAYLRQKRLLVCFEDLTAEKLRTMRVEPVGNVRLDEKALRRDFPFIYAPERRHVEKDHESLDFIRRKVSRNPENLFVEGFRWPIAQYVEEGRRPNR